jgi:hypothetical protein
MVDFPPALDDGRAARGAQPAIFPAGDQRFIAKLDSGGSAR